MEAKYDPETGELLEEKEQREYQNQPHESEIPTELLLDELYGLRMRKANAAKPYNDEIKRINDQYDPRIEELEEIIREHCLIEQKTIKGNHMEVVFQASYMKLNPQTVRESYPEIYDNCCEETKTVTRIREVRKNAK